MMMNNKTSSVADRFTETLFSWSLEDVFDEELFTNKIEKIPNSFRSVEHYLGSYVNPLLEETRAELHSSMEVLYGAPFTEVNNFQEEVNPYGNKNYIVQVSDWRNKHNKNGKEPYKALPGDFFVLANVKPKTVCDLQMVDRSWAFLSLVNLIGNGGKTFIVKASKELTYYFQKPLFIVFLANLTPLRRIWEALHMSSNLGFLNKVICIDYSEAKSKKRWCDVCSKISNGLWGDRLVKKLPFQLNESQTRALVSCLHMMDCGTKSSLELIWGPPGTGKTKTTSALLVELLGMNYTTLVCAPTNIAITKVASGVLKMVLVDTYGTDGLFCSLGNILLFGTKERLNIDSDLQMIYLDDRVEKLEKCFGLGGWRFCLTSMIDLLENSDFWYHDTLEMSESSIEKEDYSKSRNEEKRCIIKVDGCEVVKKNVPTFLEYVREEFNMKFSELKEYLSIICTHTTKSYISEKLFEDMVSLISSLVSFQSLLCQENMVSEVVEMIFSSEYSFLSCVDDISLSPNMKRKECVSSMRSLLDSLDLLDYSWFKNQKTITQFCWENASLILCTVSSSYKLHRLKIRPRILVIDEAAQLKECESIIPLQLPGVEHAILVGDEWQLPATVKSKVSEEASFGRSLYERLSSENHPRHLLSLQYRMHPSISSFPNSLFYRNQILDAAIVKMKSYERSYLPGPMFGPYSFINIIGGREHKDDDERSRKNLVEVAVIMRILQKLYQAWVESKYELSVGIVSPYAAQVVEIQTQLRFRYNENNGFQVKVKTIDGFQGGEEDIIIMSTVRCSGSHHSLDFISKPQRINVALTRARHCLWILGEERTLVKSLTVWTPIVIDAKNRKCFFNADRDDDLAKAITEVKKESGQFDDMIHNDGILFKRSKWKVFFSENFLKSFKNLEVVEAKKPVIKLLLKLSDGWRPRGPSVSVCENSLQIMSYKVEGFYVVSTVDISKEHSEYMQVLKIWDLLPYQEIPRLKNQLDIVFDKYTEEFINNCNERCLEGGSHSVESGLIHENNNDNEDSRFNNIPDSFHDIPLNSYPLAITFHKFLMMLDGTLKTSYFQRFLGIDEVSQSQIPNSRSHIYYSFLSTKEVDYTRFFSQYWPCFDSQLTKNLDPSCVFTQIVSHIKGGPQALETKYGKLTRKRYVRLSKGCGSSRLRRKEREIIYDIFQVYEKLKLESGEFDIADFVNDLHLRLKQEGYGGDQMDFVYVDDVQDLTVSQVALFKYVCSNLEEGFVFSGDVVRPIAGGIDCRIQDLRSIFYNKFVLNPMMNMKGKVGHITNMFSLSQNFRSHARILKLSQSIIELIYHFFPLSIDIIELETSMVPGEAPIIVQYKKNENAIIKLFGRCDNNSSRNAISFGAEQVILVRDETSRQSIKDIVGKQALIVTILECKDLEFQDVMLYNFFGSSLLRKKWRLIYKYMNEQDLLDSTSPQFRLFNESKDRILLAELKQLYVAIACTKKRLWICDTTEFSKPMFEYWMKKCLVQVQQLDDSLALSMQVSSSPHEWKSRGVKLYYAHNYEMATICFEKAHDTFWEMKSKAAGLQAMADHMLTSNPEVTSSFLRKAAKIFKTMGKFDSAMSCYRNLGDNEEIGLIYLENFGEFESGLQRAGECFSLAGDYQKAANAYAKGNLFSECLNVCAKGLLFDTGLAYIQSWKLQAKQDSNVSSNKGTEIEKIGQEFLERCALHYYKLENIKSMMRFIEAFYSMDSIRQFLRLLGCFDELMSLEEKLGNFVEAADIAKLRGDILVVIDLLEKAGKFKEASTLILAYVLSNSLWSSGKIGWPLQSLKQNHNLITKAISFAKNETKDFYDFVCTEAEIITNKKSDLAVMKNEMISSQRHKSVRGEILCVWRVVDAHLDSNLTEYLREGDLPRDQLMDSEERMMSQIHVSVESLVYFWNIWKDKILRIFEYLEGLQTQDVNEFTSYGEFCLEYLGVLKQCHNSLTNYVLLYSDANWARNVEHIHVRSIGNKLVLFIDVDQFIHVAQVYWSSQVLSVGFKVLHKLEAIIHTFATDSYDSLSRKCMIFTLIYEVAQFILGSKNLNRTCQNSDDLEKLIRLATDFSGYIFPLDWQKSLGEDFVSFRGTGICNKFLKQMIVEHCNLRNDLTHSQVGNIAVFVLSSSRLNDELFEKIMKRMNQNLPWKAFFKCLQRSRGSYFPSSSLICRFHGVLVDAYNANCMRECDPISPSFFFYLVERFVIWLSISFKGYFITTKSAFVEWLVYEEIHTTTTPCFNTLVGFLQSDLPFVTHVIKECLNNEQDMIDWINKSPSRDNKSYSLLVSRMVLILCLLRENFGMGSSLLFDLLGIPRITKHMPLKFCDNLKSYLVRCDVTMLAEAFEDIGNSLVVVSFGISKPWFEDFNVVDMSVNRSKNDILRTLF
ncbi:uncharacterized protein LOC133817181 isoform X2 [Humulus lupulus]|uniref:uncharacterized protein LOC133817181 isoform X2 n=1 Tax=Humulus lupulus TaxID=3486 RepID=UPI002B405EBA|nr:uncharacterized protein LOC133817181 isoform X2 [Humulus lupulus]